MPTITKQLTCCSKTGNLKGVRRFLLTLSVEDTDDPNNKVMSIPMDLSPKGLELVTRGIVRATEPNKRARELFSDAGIE